MKKHWLYMLTVPLVVTLTMFGAAAELDGSLEVFIEEDGIDFLPVETDIPGDSLEFTDIPLDEQFLEGQNVQMEDIDLSSSIGPDTSEGTALAQEEGQLDSVTEEPMMSNEGDFEIDENGVLVKYRGQGGDVVIPDGVTSIYPSSFYGCTGLTSVTIPDGVTSIGERAFSGCSGLIRVILPESIEYIGEEAFRFCGGLTDIVLPKNLKNMGFYAFTDTGIVSITIKGDVNWASAPFAGSSVETAMFEEGVTSVPEGMFDGCTTLVNVSLPNSLISLGSHAFNGCKNLKNINIPDRVESIGMEAFYYCTSLKR